MSTKAGHMQILLLRHAASRYLRSCMHQKIWRIFIAALFGFAPIWKQPKCLLIVERISKFGIFM